MLYREVGNQESTAYRCDLNAASSFENLQCFRDGSLSTRYCRATSAPHKHEIKQQFYNTALRAEQNETAPIPTLIRVWTPTQAVCAGRQPQERQR